MTNRTVERIEALMLSRTDETQITCPEPVKARTQVRTAEALIQPARIIRHARNAEEFRNMVLPEKEPLIEGLLYRRDLVCFAGRRRSGKTSLLLQLGCSLTTWALPNFVGYPISNNRTALFYLLEDDSRELQDRLNRMLISLADGGETDGRLIVRTKDDFYRDNVPIGIGETQFKKVIIEDCRETRPDLIAFDNLGFLIGADYNNPTLTHHFIQFVIGLSQEYDCAIITAAHPRKQSTVRQPVTLEKDRDMFFEEVMGASHFVNCCGSLWGIERVKDGAAHFYAGTQRLSTPEGSYVDAPPEGFCDSFPTPYNVDQIGRVRRRCFHHNARGWAQ
jgi:AAA domain